MTPWVRARSPPEENEPAVVLPGRGLCPGTGLARARARHSAVLGTRAKLDEMRDVAGFIQLHTGGNDFKPLHELLLGNQHFSFFPGHLF